MNSHFIFISIFYFYPLSIAFLHMRFFVLSALLLLLTPADIVALSTLMALASVKDLYEQTEHESNIC